VHLLLDGLVDGQAACPDVVSHGVGVNGGVYVQYDVHSIPNVLVTTASFRK